MQHSRSNGKLMRKVVGKKNVVRDQAEQKVIQQIAWMADGGWGPVVIAQKLMAEGIKIRGKDKWHPNTVARILKRAAEDEQ